MTTISTFSQNTYPKQINDSLVVITTEQLKQTNLIFLEHDKLSKENVLLQEKINTQNEIIINYKKLDEERLIQQKELNDKVVHLNKEIKKKNLLLCGSCLLVGISWITAILIH